MARARNIKPAFFINEDLAELPMADRLFFIGLWTIADCCGRIEWRPKRIKNQIFPYDESVDIKEIAINLERFRFIRFYSSQEKTVLEVVNFEKHQNPHKNERDKGSDLPAWSPEASILLGCKEVSEKIGTSTDKIGTARADSLLLIPDSLNPQTDSLNDSASGEAGEFSPHDPRGIIWGGGLSVLKNAGEKESQARKFLGKLAKSHGDDSLAFAIEQTIIDKPIEPKSYLVKLLSDVPATISKDWTPDAETQSQIWAYGLDQTEANIEADIFRMHFLESQKPHSNWNACFAAWCYNQVKRQKVEAEKSKAGFDL